MNVGYYPGCTLKGKAKSLENSTRYSVEVLGHELVEIPDWTCCGATTPLTSTQIANLIAQTRLLAGARDAGYDVLVTTCPFCFSTLKRANVTLKNDELTRRRMNTYLADDRRLRDYETPPPDWVPYEGEVRVLHLLEWLRDIVGFDAIRNAIIEPLTGLKIAPFYGCQLLRPADELAMCDPENPKIFEDFLAALGVDVPDFPARIDCCGSYLSIAKPDAAIRAVHRILDSAHRLGADAVAVTCPLCFFNLDFYQPDIQKVFPEFKPIPIIYFTQLLASALNAPLDKLGFESHKIDPGPVFKSLFGKSPREVTA